MPLSEYITPVLAAGGPITLVLVALRFGPDAVVRLLAGTVAVLTRDEKRGERCLKVLRVLRSMDDPAAPHAEPAGLPPNDDADATPNAKAS